MKYLIRLLLPLLVTTYFAIIIGQEISATKRQYLILAVLAFVIARFLLGNFYTNYVEGKPLNKKAIWAGVCLSALLLGATDRSIVPQIVKHRKATLTIYALGEKNPASFSTEVWILGATNGTGKYDLSRISLDPNWEKKPDGTIVSHQHQPSRQDIIIEEADDPTVKFLRHDWSGKIKIHDGQTDTTVDLYKSAERSEFDYHIRNIDSVVSRKDRVSEILLYVLTFFFLFALFYPLLTAFLAGTPVYYIVNLLLWTGLFLLHFYLSLSAGEIVFLFVISCAAGYFFCKAFGKKDGFSNTLGNKSILILLLISLYASFGFVGDRLFLEDNEPVTIQQLSFFLLFAAWFFSIAFSFFYLLYRLKNDFAQARSTSAPPGKPRIIQLWGLCFIILTGVWMIYLLAFFPGVMSSDSLGQWGQATGVLPLDNSHPVFHTFFNKGLLLFSRSPATIAFAQILFLAAVASTFITFLYIRGIPRNWLVLFTLIFALIPANGINVITLWKDIPWTISLLWLTLMLAKITGDNSYFRTIRQNPLAFLGLALALVAVAQFRHNGILVYLFVLLALSCYAFKYKNRAIAASLGLSLLCLVAFKLLVVNRKDIGPVPAGLTLMAPVNGIAAVMQTSRLTPDVEQRMEAIMPKNEWVDLYSPYWANAYQFKTNGAYVKGLSELSTKQALKMYLTTFYHDPFLVIKDRLQGADYLWDVSRPPHAHNSKYNILLEPNNYGLVQKETKLKPILIDYLKASETLGEVLWWRAAIYNIFILLLIFFVLKYGSFWRTLPFLPWFGAACSLLPSIAWQDFRYVYFAGFLFGFLFLLTLSDHIPSQPADEKKINHE